MATDPAKSTDTAAGIVLFAHGARDARWAEPFERLADTLRSLRSAPRGGPVSGPVTLAFLELMEPDLPTAVTHQVAAGCTTVTIVPVFFGQGGHVRQDLPVIVDQCRAAHPGIEIRCATPVGEDSAVIDAIAQYCLRQV
ncbi:sirohydrochlorin chelatase [Paraburkholderia rhizosphaerae]|uniref:Sirohydrochlorin cobaltochelatase n=1 Tax=Paraburkholderia rhizosphaerae TaxID=480658 RepID=A0A4R8LKZ7_9BURK|nr:CbiX/SirB N-terminal domain-containing protein [Paraburkholderia rhizosphaerae]TDY44424.1 sirohydrochlorin cobaltochelatase [Paraburkholderia rhizosphaerae]